MAIGFILAIVILGLITLCGVMAFKSYNTASDYSSYRASEEDKVKAKQYKSKGAMYVVLSILLAIVFILVPFSFHTVDTGEVAVVKELGKIVDVRQPGTYFDFWLTRSRTTYDTKVQNLEIESAAYSSDAQTMTYQMTVQYEILGDKVKNISTEYGSHKALKSRITSIVNDKTKAVLSAHKAMDIIAKRAEMSPEVSEAISNAVGENYYVNVVSVAITNIDFSDAFEQAVEDKMVAEQQQLKADYENAAKIAKAEADAKAKLLAAEAEAKANELLEKTLTDNILQEMYIDKWDGKLPSVVAGEETGIMIPSMAE